MDVNKALGNLRDNVQDGLRIAYTTEQVPYGVLMETLTNLAEGFDNLDTAIVRDGLMPDDWVQRDSNQQPFGVKR